MSAPLSPAWEQIRRGVTAGFPEFYKARLLESQFEVSK